MSCSRAAREAHFRHQQTRLKYCTRRSAPMPEPRSASTPSRTASPPRHDLDLHDHRSFDLTEGPGASPDWRHRADRSAAAGRGDRLSPDATLISLWRRGGCCRSLQAKFSRSVDQATDNTKTSFSQMAKAYGVKARE